MSEDNGTGDKVDLGMAHGRFQIFHRDHLRYVLAARRRCRHLLVGITSPDPAETPLERTAPHRKEPAANPLTYYERVTMISSCLYAEGLRGDEFSIVPFPIESPGALANYAPPETVHLLTIYDAWGEEKAARLRGLGYRTEILWRSAHKEISGTRIRAAMATGEDWEHLVPPATRDFLVAHRIPARVTLRTTAAR
ncbi:nicotinate-nucleotide adenylyltransferase [Streptomyces rubiginosohelvolus]|uniref:nicotinate-nucleotide adenylyltransferase n=1 Tax=Streptomyces rubiginosohelvolus TaxID=67362 RepID=UPI003648469F